ncbi:ATP-binding protein [Grimontia kaedaensis]|uniref:ATP-binding protein n=1 Tax=Grimontia kaedaensis TaxID=2872157 RepID=A0ABY4WQP3_9GAMM|nr:ATP-binding protein [Grimontia kaedaensis]USH01906.1 ATP-binding protein [Grimontia kaedaensis]
MSTYCETSQRSTATRIVDAAPYASSLIEGHRDFGYNLKTALADIIDNSISAGASTIKVEVDTVSDSPYVAISDDGCGMSSEELYEAMRLGTKNPTHERAPKQLGRFGLGLKSASFSQCRSLTVLSRKNGLTSCARWDLDLVAEKNSWALQLIDNPKEVVGYELLPSSGTVVIWNKLDRLSGNTELAAKRTEYLNAEFSKAEYHLRLVFHRFLEGDLKITLNGRTIKSLDPMAKNHPSTQKDPVDSIEIDNEIVVIQSFTIPHYKNLSQLEWDELGGPDGHIKSQGLYIYRENRLIIAGGWQGLAKQTELTKLSRIAIDIPNSIDSQWKIDVKKSSAQLPPLVRERLSRLIERFVGTSKRTYKRRGQKLVDVTMYPFWNRVITDGNIYFKPNLNHPVIESYSESLPAEFKEGFERCIRLIGAGLPIDALHAELVGGSESVSSIDIIEKDLKETIFRISNVLLENNTPLDKIKETLQSQPLFQESWESSEIIIDKYLKEKGL